MNLHLLRLFAAVAQQGSFSRAAETLHISQPAISKGVREFEAQVGSRLLERGPGGIRLTPAGRVLAAHAQILFAAERAAEDDLASLRGLETGILAVGASTTIATYLLPPIVGAFHRAHPTIELRLASGNTQDIVDRLLARELDVALVEGPVHANGVTLQAWQPDELILIVPPTHRFASARRSVPPSSLQEEILAVREAGSGTREVVATALADARIVPRQVIEIGSTEAIKQLVASGLGVAIVSATAASDQIRLGRLCQVNLAGLTIRRMLTRISLPGRQPSAAAARFGTLLDAASVGGEREERPGGAAPLTPAKG
jgi:DNA-binding transcriptional LysR family regulator